MLKILRFRNDMEVETLHHLVPLSSSRIGTKLTSEDESYVHHIQSISLCELYMQLIFVGWYG